MVKLKKPVSLLNNVNILYLVFFLTILNLGYFLYNKDNQSIFLFAVLCLIVYLFNQNMIVVLLFSIITINVLILINMLNREGFEDKDEDTKDKKEKIKENKDKKEKIKEKEKDVKKPKERMIAQLDESEDVINKGKLEETKYPDNSDDDLKKKMEKLGSLTKTLDGLNVTEINRMINKFNDFVERF